MIGWILVFKTNSFQLTVKQPYRLQRRRVDTSYAAGEGLRWECFAGKQAVQEALSTPLACLQTSQMQASAAQSDLSVLLPAEWLFTCVGKKKAVGNCWLTTLLFCIMHFSLHNREKVVISSVCLLVPCSQCTGLQRNLSPKALYMCPPNLYAKLQKRISGNK